MKLGVLLVLFADLPFEKALDRAVEAGLSCVEIGTGGYPGDAHCKPGELLADRARVKAFRRAVTSRGLEISALACHGNPLHPRVDFAKASHELFVKTVELAESLEVNRLTLFSGCPGDSDSARYPNWVTCAWPNEYGELLEWQWREKVVPYWRGQAGFASAHGVKLAFELHPGFVVYNPASLLRLREACGEAVGANLDPSHLFWQGIDLESAIAELGRSKAIFHVHAKDTAIMRPAAVNGVLDTTPLGDVAKRSWIFRTMGYGHSEFDWRRFLVALRMAGYDDVLSIEQEDALLSVEEGFAKAVAFLRNVMPVEPPVSNAWWV
ncbi:MAG: sugar phosphate isomerase/epimerase [Candidatus Limnocylindrales bacterium]|jgi:sugar phosphate isomerase/epimerase